MSWTAVLLSLFFAVSAFAAGDYDTPGSQYTHQADNGRMELRAIGEYDDVTTVYNNPPANINQREAKGMTYSGTLEYGLFSWLSLGGGASFVKQSTTYTPTGVDNDFTTSGMQDPWAYANIRMPFGPFTLHLSGIYDFTPGPQTVDAVGNMNGYSGGDTGTAFGSLELNLGAAYFGFGAGYDFIKKSATQQTTNSTGVVTTNITVGGKETQFFAYLETATRPIALGISASYISSAATQTSADGGAMTDNADHFTASEGSLYIPILSQTVSLIPKVSYELIHCADPPTSQKISKMSAMSGELTLRLKF